MGTASSNAISSSLLRRLAAAVDCQAFNTDRWVVADRVFPHRVGSVHPTLDAATAAAGPLGFGVFGPYVNTEAPLVAEEPMPEEPMPMAFSGVCYHDQKLCEIICPELKSPVTMRIDYTPRIGDPVQLTQDTVDAVVLSQNAFDKFFLPYLFEIGGVNYAYQRRHG